VIHHLGVLNGGNYIATTKVTNSNSSHSVKSALDQDAESQLNPSSDDEAAEKDK
jgi:hypothetical protein